MGVIYEDKSDAFLKRVTDAAGAPGGGLDRATQFLDAKITELMPGQGAGVIAGTGGNTGVRAKYIPSNPGSPPGVRTNRLRGSITNAQIGPLKWAAGTNVSYARALEFGTSKMPARPVYRRALNENKDGIFREFSVGFKRRMGGA
jgi:HK97 gp10 family phage protein